MKIGTYRVENTIPFTFVQKKRSTHRQAAHLWKAFEIYLLKDYWRLVASKQGSCTAARDDTVESWLLSVTAFLCCLNSVSIFFFKMFSIQLAILQLNLFDRPFYQILRRRFSDFFSSSFWAVLAKWTREFTHFDAIPKGWEQRETRIRMRLDSGISWSASEAKQRQETVES